MNTRPRRETREAMASNELSRHGEWTRSFYQGLRTLVDTAFPKRCPKCGLTFASADDFLRETVPVRNIKLQETSGLFALDPDAVDGGVGVFRNCTCGTTLMADFKTRRDNSADGIRRRQQFETLLDMLTAKNIDRAIARTELLKVLAGQSSRIVDEVIDADQLRPLT